MQKDGGNKLHFSFNATWNIDNAVDNNIRARLVLRAHKVQTSVDSSG